MDFLEYKSDLAIRFSITVAAELVCLDHLSKYINGKHLKCLQMFFNKSTGLVLVLVLCATLVRDTWKRESGIHFMHGNITDSR